MNKGRELKPVLLWIDGVEVDSRKKSTAMLGISAGYLSNLLKKNEDSDFFLCKGHRVTRRPPKKILSLTDQDLSPDLLAEAIQGVRDELREGREGLVRMVHAYDEAMARLRKVEELAVSKGRKAVHASYREIPGTFGSAEKLG